MLSLDYNKCPQTCQNEVKKRALGESVTCKAEDIVEMGCVCQEGYYRMVSPVKKYYIHQKGRFSDADEVYQLLFQTNNITSSFP